LTNEVSPQALTGAMFDLSMAIDRVGNAASASIGLNHTDLICLFLLVRRGPTSPSVVAAEMGLTPAAISAVAARLETAGHVPREIDPTDRRRIVLSASNTGAWQTFGTFESLFQQTAELFANHDQADLARLAKLIDAYRQVLVRYAETLKSKST